MCCVCKLDACVCTHAFLRCVLTVPGQAILSELTLSLCLFFLQSFSAPPAGNEVLKLKAVIGYNGNGRGNMVWDPDTGMLGRVQRAESCVSPRLHTHTHSELRSVLPAVGLGSLLQHGDSLC